jgi:hypothetical protein
VLDTTKLTRAGIQLSPVEQMVRSCLRNWVA